MRPEPLVICSKSTWRPAIRREHAIAVAAIEAGHEVIFLPRPVDVRGIRTPEGRGTWRRALSGSARRDGGVTVRDQGTLVPGHRSDWAHRLDTMRLRQALSRIPRIEEARVVATQPWHWDAVVASPARRRIYDCADDWAALIPRRSDAIRAALTQVGAQADAIVAVSAELASDFDRSDVKVIPNGVAPQLLGPLTPPAQQRMVYAGTFSERFDAMLAEGILDELPEWRLDLYGPAQYAGSGDRPGAPLVRLLEAHPDRVAWHGAIGRDRLAAALDGAEVLIAPHRMEQSRGQSSMKLLDYAARGRPIVVSVGVADADGLAAAGAVEAEGPTAFARAVERAASESPDAVGRRRAWAETQAWAQRFKQWWAATA